MKKERSIFALLLRDFAVYAAGIIVATGLVIGILYGASVIAVLLSEMITVEMGLVVFFTIAGTALYIEFKPEKKKVHVRRGRGRQVHSAVYPPSPRMLKAYSAK